jgi:N-acetylglucosaminyldiphosphoundecaprenol N-acetyl-beta-D-mannosaminyltransferase
MRKTENILGVLVDSITMAEAMEKMTAFLSEDRVHAVFTPNAEIIMASQRDPELRDILNSADLLTADGAGVVLASRILKRKLPEKVSGIDIVINSFKLFSGTGISYYFFGSRPGVAEKAAQNAMEQYPGLKVAGFRNGYFDTSEEEDIINDINSSGAEILLVALGAPKQEKWIHANKDKLKARICMGVGGTLDVLAGEAKLAPDFFRRNGLEWLYRLCKEPRRAKRILDLPRFMLKVLKTRLFHFT